MLVRQLATSVRQAAPAIKAVSFPMANVTSGISAMSAKVVTAAVPTMASVFSRASISTDSKRVLDTDHSAKAGASVAPKAPLYPVVIGAGGVGLLHGYGQIVRSRIVRDAIASPVFIARSNSDVLKTGFTFHNTATGYKTFIPPKNYSVRSLDEFTKEVKTSLEKGIDNRADIVTLAVKANDYYNALEHALKSDIMKPDAKIVICLNGGKPLNSDIKALLYKYDPYYQLKLMLTANDIASGKSESGNTVSLKFGGKFRVKRYDLRDEKYVPDVDTKIIIDYLSCVLDDVIVEEPADMEMAVCTKGSINAGLSISIATGESIDQIVQSPDYKVLLGDVNHILETYEGSSIDYDHIRQFARCVRDDAQKGTKSFPSIYQAWEKGSSDLELGNYFGPIMDSVTRGAPMSADQIKTFAAEYTMIDSYLTRILDKLSASQLLAQLETTRCEYPAYHSYVQAFIQAKSLTVASSEAIKVTPSAVMVETVSAGVGSEKGKASSGYDSSHWQAGADAKAVAALLAGAALLTGAALVMFTKVEAEEDDKASDHILA